MMVWAMRAFAPRRRGLPLMLFAFASSLPSALAASAAGLAVLNMARSQQITRARGAHHHGEEMQWLCWL